MSNGERPEGGQAAWFVHLHLDTVHEVKPSYKEGEFVYEVEGKPRPMLVLFRYERLERGRQWFLVLPITSKAPGPANESRYQRIGKCLDAQTEDFVSLEPCRLPENLLHSDCGRSWMIQPCDPIAFRNAVKVAEHISLGGKRQRQDQALSAPG